MKWFQHQTHSHTDLALRDIMADFGMEGYGFYWICLELIGQQGDNYRLNGVKSWQKALKDISKLDDKKIDKLLNRFSELNLICRKSMNKGELYIPKMKNYSDDYTKKIRRVSEHSTDNVHVDKIRIDKIIQEYIRVKNWDKSIKENPLLLTDIYKRNCRIAKSLILMANNDSLVIKAMENMAAQYNEKKLSWTLETVAKHYLEFNGLIQTNKRVVPV